ncbi:hypothetical protein PR048_000753 [Dryococelus australis]|uniref:Uncharacterized protein n=1 Tax=Dryococelus australis TaxID=614101 RepID=A0ABQ9IFI7_9NEOP|nr:hypothetical protein PR048_000753 [Dryococelus australis]
MELPNARNCVYWYDVNTNIETEQAVNILELTVRYGASARRLGRSFFFDGTATGESYRTTLHENIVPAVHKLYPADDCLSQQDVAQPWRHRSIISPDKANTWDAKAQGCICSRNTVEWSEWALCPDAPSLRNEGAGETGDPRESPPNSVRHDSLRKSGGYPAGNRTRFALVEDEMSSTVTDRRNFTRPLASVALCPKTFPSRTTSSVPLWLGLEAMVTADPLCEMARYVTFRHGRQQQQLDTHASCTLAEHCHIVRVATKVRDVPLHPAQCCHLVLHAGIARHVGFCGLGGSSGRWCQHDDWHWSEVWRVGDGVYVCRVLCKSDIKHCARVVFNSDKFYKRYEGRLILKPRGQSQAADGREVSRADEGDSHGAGIKFRLRVVAGAWAASGQVNEKLVQSTATVHSIRHYRNPPASIWPTTPPSPSTSAHLAKPMDGLSTCTPTGERVVTTPPATPLRRLQLTPRRAAQHEMVKHICWRWPNDQSGEGDLEVLKNGKCSDPHRWILRAADCR